MDSEAGNTKLVVNQHYDESLEVNDPEEVASYYSPTPRKADAGDMSPVLQANKSQNQGLKSGSEHHMMQPRNLGMSPDEMPTRFDHPSLDDSPQPPQEKPKAPNQKTEQASYSEGDSEDSETSSDDDEDNTGGIEGAYDPADFEHLTVNQEIKELFQYITRYTPQTIELEHKLKPFNPDYIPAVGDIDAFLKVPRLDDKPVTLGLTVLDEPCSKQSDPTVLDLQLRNISKTAGLKEMQVRSVADAENNHKAIDSWIESIDEIHRGKPAPTVHYQKSMPDIDTLMTEWPPEIETLLKNLNLPTADLDCSLQNYADIICSILDIPVHNNMVQSLHLLFSLYSAFKQMQHFQENPIGGHNDDQEPQVLHFE